MVQRSWWHEPPGPAEQLFLLAGRQSLAFFTKAARGGAVQGWESFTWQGQPAYLDCLQEATAQSSLFNHQYQATHLVWQDAPATLLPAKLEATQANDVAQTLLGSPAFGQMKSGSLPPYQLHWQLPADAEAAFWQSMPIETQTHLLLQTNQLPAGLMVDVCGKIATMAASADGQLLWLKQQTFDTPEDLLYHSLNALQTLGLPLADTDVWLSGMLTEESSLYATLHQYLPRLYWRAADETTEGLPAHYFTLYQHL